MKPQLPQKTLLLSLTLLTLILSTIESTYGQGSTKHEIKVAVLYSSNPNVPTTNAEIQQHSTKVFRESNEILDKSGVNMKLSLVAISEIAFQDIESIDAFSFNAVNIKDFNNLNSDSEALNNEFKRISYLRSFNKADVICYVHRKSNPDKIIVNQEGKKDTIRDAIGINGANPHGYKTAIFKINFNAYQFRRNIFLHEMSHLFGLTHEMGATSPYEIGNEGKFTIMTTNCAHTMGDIYKNKNNPGKFIDNEKELELIFSGKNAARINQGYYSECNWDAVTVLNENAYEYSIWGDTFLAEPYARKTAPRNLKDISLVNDCVAWGIDNYNVLWKWDRFKWDKIETNRKFVQLSAKNFDTVFLIDDEGTVITYDDYTKVFGMIPHSRKATKIASNSKGNIWIIDEEGKAYERQNQRFVENGPSQKVSEILIDNNNKAYVLAGSDLLSNKNNAWARFQTNVKKASIGLDGTMVIIDSNNKIKISTNGSHPREIRNNVPSYCLCEGDEKINCRDIDNNIGTDVSVYNKNRIWILSEGHTYKYVGQNGFQRVRELGAY